MWSCGLCIWCFTLCTKCCIKSFTLRVRVLHRLREEERNMKNFSIQIRPKQSKHTHTHHITQKLKCRYELRKLYGTFKSEVIIIFRKYLRKKKQVVYYSTSSNYCFPCLPCCWIKINFQFRSLIHTPAHTLFMSVSVGECVSTSV